MALPLDTMPRIDGPRHTGWTDERRARQAEMIRSWRPWERSTGPRTAKGKATAARNGDKGGTWKAESNNLRALKREFSELMRQQRDMLARVQDADP